MSRGKRPGKRGVFWGKNVANKFNFSWFDNTIGLKFQDTMGCGYSNQCGLLSSFGLMDKMKKVKQKHYFF